MTKSQAIVNTFSVVDSCSVVVVGSESGGWHREENSSPKKSSPSPTKKEGNAMPMPGESSGGGYSGETYSRRGDPTITTDSESLFSLLFLVEPSNTVQPWSRREGGSFFIPGQRSASSPGEKKESTLDSKRCGNKTTGRDILPLCSGERKNNQSNHPLLSHFLTLLGVLSWSRRTYNLLFPKEREREKKNKPASPFILPKVSAYNSRSKRTKTDYISSSTSQ